MLWREKFPPNIPGTKQSKGIFMGGLQELPGNCILLMREATRQGLTRLGDARMGTIGKEMSYQIRKRRELYFISELSWPI